jgi:hypothetical protein
VRRITFAILLFCSCKKTAILQNENIIQPKPYTTWDLNEKIFAELKQQGSFSWKNQSVDFIWSALNQSDHMLAVGYQLEGTKLNEDLFSDLESGLINDLGDVLNTDFNRFLLPNQITREISNDTEALGEIDRLLADGKTYS